jgi:arylsulfatase A-like enzyme
LRAARLEGTAPIASDNAVAPSSIRLARPNVIVYLVDTLRADHLGTYGYAPPTSPSLDAMAAEGIVFERMFAQSGWTRTSVASLMTGLNPPVHGILGRDDALPEEAITLPVLMGDLGYETLAVITNSNVSETFGFDRGFDTFRYLREQVRDLNPEVHRLSDDVNTEFFAWLDDRETDRPFFAYLHTSDPYAPYTPRPPLSRPIRRRHAALRHSLAPRRSSLCRHTERLHRGAGARRDGRPVRRRDRVQRLAV